MMASAEFMLLCVSIMVLTAVCLLSVNKVKKDAQFAVLSRKLCKFAQ